MSLTAGIILGILIGWLAEWVIDWLYWRGRREKPLTEQIIVRTDTLEISDRSIEIDALIAENETFKDRLERYASVGDKLATENHLLKTQLESCNNLSDGLKAENMRIRKQLDGFNRAPDDLKVIKGIGPEIERLLHQAGIRSFAQLADLTPPDLERILGPIVKRLADEQDLLDQARALANQKQ